MYGLAMASLLLSGVLAWLVHRLVAVPTVHEEWGRVLVMLATAAFGATLGVLVLYWGNVLLLALATRWCMLATLGVILLTLVTAIRAGPTAAHVMGWPRRKPGA